MLLPLRLKNERAVWRLFEVSLWLKGALALVEVLGGIAAYFLSHDFLVHVANVTTQGELAEDPHDIVANFLLHTMERLSINGQHFAAIYLFGHGAIKLWLVIGLLRRQLWYYPTALVAFTLFVAYQVYRFTFTQSLWLLAVTLIDLVVIALTWHEFQHLRQRQAPHGGGE